jgi:hypothetical protein
MRSGKKESNERGKERERENGRSLLQFAADRGTMTSHLAAFSLVDSVCRTSLRSPWPWPLEFAAVRCDILGFGVGSGLCCPEGGGSFCSSVGRGFGDGLGYRCSKLIKKDPLVSDLCLPQLLNSQQPDYWQFWGRNRGF